VTQESPVNAVLVGQAERSCAPRKLNIEERPGRFPGRNEQYIPTIGKTVSVPGVHYPHIFKLDKYRVAVGSQRYASGASEFLCPKTVMHVDLMCIQSPLQATSLPGFSPVSCEVSH